MRSQISPGISLQYSIKWTFRQRSNTLNYHDRAYLLININEAKYAGNMLVVFILNQPCKIFRVLDSDWLNDKILHP